MFNKSPHNCCLILFSFGSLRMNEGLIVLLGSGVHTVWAFWEMYTASSWLEKEVIITVGSWYVATIIGAAIAAVLIPKWSKRKLYVSEHRINWYFSS